MTEKQLMELRDKISDAKNQVNKLQGRLDAARETLEKQWECKTVEDAYTKLEELKQRRETMQEKINSAMAQLEADYDIA